MRSVILSSVLLSTLVALSGSQQAEAKRVADNGSLRILTARQAQGVEKGTSGSPYNVAGSVNAHAQHRRHHHKNSRRAQACSASSSASSSSSSGTKKTVAAYSDKDSESSSDSDSSDASSSSSSSPSSSSSSPSSSSSSQSASQTSSASSSEETDVSPLAGSSGSGSSTTASGSVSGFSGTNTGIGSWFHTNSGQDSTNGMSWCETKYQDDWPCFAPSVGTMMSGYSSRQDAAKAYCGREAKVTNTKTGSSATMFICDGFDDKWVRTPGSIDLTTGAFATMNNGEFDGNKNNVLQVKWELTGNVVEKGTFQKNKYVK